jgi:acetyltransferase-like isoleucine patch superfamily enzyme
MLKELFIQFRYVLPVWFIMLITGWWPNNRITVRWRGLLISFFVGSCGKNFQIGSGVTINNPQNLHIGNDVYIAKGTWMNALGTLIIEDEVVVAPYVVISTMQHVFKNNSVRFGGSIADRVVIGKGTWVAAHAAIKCGVKVGSGNIVAANSSVVKDTPDNVIMGGVPAKIIKENNDGEAAFFTRAESGL